MQRVLCGQSMPCIPYTHLTFGLRQEASCGFCTTGDMVQLSVCVHAIGWTIDSLNSV